MFPLLQSNRKYISGGDDMLLPINVGNVLDLEDICEQLPYDKQWEFPRERLKLGKLLNKIFLHTFEKIVETNLNVPSFYIFSPMHKHVTTCLWICESMQLLWYYLYVKDLASLLHGILIL